MYDNTCKFLEEEFSQDLATWLLGEALALTELSPKELSLESIRTDSLILQQSDRPWHGMPLGGFGAGCIGRSPRGDLLSKNLFMSKPI